ncbi:proline-rich protein 36 isoform X1 [Hippoglossus stenolepis]|uniref:proline-rich protein 36 isoform X1 n=1 Tax=Hippoglossus stenolepis TaxID=195615 RepID=UPI001FAF2B9E|nr:proline-rich protein 36 isoform X1 [Hippoglossus stenolepis]
MDQNTKIDQGSLSTLSTGNLGFDLLLQVLELRITDSSLLPNDTPAEEECGPQQPHTECHMPLGAAPLSMEQTVMPATEEECGPQQPQTEHHMPLGAAPLRLEQPVMPVPQEECGPQQPQTECHMLLGAAPLSMEQPVMPATEEEWGPQQPQTECHMPLGAALLKLEQPVMPATEEERGPQQPQTERYMPLGAALLKLMQPVMPAPRFHCAQTSFPLLPPYRVPTEKMFSPQKSQTGHFMPLGAAPLKLEQPVMLAPGFLTAKTNPPLHSYDAPAKGSFVPQHPQTERHMPLGAAPLSLEQPVMPTPKEEWGPQHTQTECRMLLGAAPLKLEQPVMPAPGFLTAKMNPSFLQSYDAPAKEQFVPQQPWTERYMPLGAALLKLMQPVMPAPGFHCAQTSFPLLPPYRVPTKKMFSPQKSQTGHFMPLGAAPLKLEQPVMLAPGFLTAKTNPPLLHSYDAPAKESFVPQQPQTECHMPLGASPLSLEQPVMPAPGFHCAQTGFPLLPPYHVPAEEMFSPQQSQTGHYKPLGAAPFSLQPPVMPAPGPALPRYQPPSALQPNYMYCQAAPFSHSQVNNGPVVSRPQVLVTNLVPVGLINRKIVYGVSAYSAPPVASNVPGGNAFVSRNKRYCPKPHNESSPYVKKPPNAFMLFRTEQRPNVVVELQNSDCAAVNRLLGQRWKSMSKDEQAKYYEHAEREKHLHSQAFPDWSAKDNYAKKRKRIRRKRPAMT